MAKALPKQVRKQIKDVENIEADITAGLVADNADDKTQEEIDALLLEVDPGKEEPPVGDPPPEDPPANVTKLHPEEPKVERTDWKQKYNVLQGKYDAEVPRMAGELREALGRISDLEKPPVEETPEMAVLTDAEIEDYGTDLIGVIERKATEMARNTFEPMVKDLQGQITSLKAQVGITDQRVAVREQNDVFAMLDKDVKDWRKVNTSQPFKDWLAASDPFSGQTRSKLMLEAFDAKNAQRVKHFFESFLKENAAVTSSAAAPPAGEAGNSATLKLENYIAPGTPKTGTGQAGAPKEKRVWTNQEIASFYSDVNKGHYKKRPEDKARIEADIVAATTEGRIRT